MLELPSGMMHLLKLRTDIVKAVENRREFHKSNKSPSEKHDILQHEHYQLLMLDENAKKVLQEWFSFRFLEVKRITFDHPASLLEKIIKYSEEVNPMGTWKNLKARLGAGHRCYGFFHPALPNDTVIYIEVALTDNLSSSIQPLLVETSTESETQATHAIFYAIIQTKTGLKGIELGGSLIKSAVNLIRQEFPNVKHFSTLSPIPGLKNWLDVVFAHYSSDANNLNSGSEKYSKVAILTNDEKRKFTDYITNHKNEIEQYLWNRKEKSQIDQILKTPELLLIALLEEEGVWDSLPSCVEYIKHPLLRLTSIYIVGTKHRGLAIDPVANFHLRNGARAERINWMADMSPKRLKQSFGLMINYYYPLDDLKSNSEEYLLKQHIVRGDQVQTLFSEKTIN
eukprot:TRINITY_DN6943_c0_g1_i3.p1 TRINITY_DN6943_c0_g1~~TRINITY_DN6943_c0_g1_i3.p1  ORF type:complete len:397 (-),score=32.28 TRINITY_DN6943_c0_g1_i3:7-1197(-)